MKVMIHAAPKRMWYVEGFLIPSLLAQGIEPDVYCDTKGLGNLGAFLDSVRDLHGDGTWHIQDDVLICRDFVKRCEEITDGVAYGFANVKFTDDVSQVGRVNVFNSWHSFQCVRIPDEYAREYAEWISSGAWKKVNNHELSILFDGNCGDDTFFHEFMLARHPSDIVTNMAPNIVEHVDFLVGGSILNKARCFWPRAHYWEDESLVDELKAKVKVLKQNAVF